VQQVKVDPTYLDMLSAFLDNAQQALDTAFGAPRASGGYPDKLKNTHGVTAVGGSNAIMSALDGKRGDVQTRLDEYLNDLQEKIQAAKKAYQATDHNHSGVLAAQINGG